MKHPTHDLQAALAILLTTLAFAGCAGRAAPERLTSDAPNILNPRSEPEKIELNHFLQAKSPQQLFVDIQDFSSEVTAVKVKVGNLPLEIPLRHAGGTTWAGEIPSDILRRLAVSGRTMNYSGYVVAQDALGRVSVSKTPFQFEIAAPSNAEDVT